MRIPHAQARLEVLVRAPEIGTDPIIATLGPEGTSSEAAAGELAARLGQEDNPGAVTLFPSYEQAHAAVLDGSASCLLVANAYHGINEFYMHQRLGLARAFVFDTPQYGLASPQDRPLPLACEIVTHPAPRALIQQLLPPGYSVAKVAHVSSTSAAAETVSRGEADLALTTGPAADGRGLRFISPTRPIRMLWSVFVRLPESEHIVPVHA